MWLNNVWFGLFVAVVAGYLVLDGFDLCVGSTTTTGSGRCRSPVTPLPAA
jgi:cytochrome bd-type quinol oxidase subunit 2